MGGWKLQLSQVYMFCFEEMQVDEVFKWIWETRCTNKWRVFAWLLAADRLNTRAMLRRRAMTLPNDDHNCSMCAHGVEESIEHLIFRCDFSVQCWDKLCVRWSVSGNRLQLIHETKTRWVGPMFMEVLIVGAWGIWKERNNKCFRGIEASIGSWVDRFRSDFELLKHRSKPNLESFILNFVATL